MASWLLAMSGYCTVCDATCRANNAVGWAALHHKRTGHRVLVEVTRCVAFG